MRIKFSVELDRDEIESFEEVASDIRFLTGEKLGGKIGELFSTGKLNEDLSIVATKNGLSALNDVVRDFLEVGFMVASKIIRLGKKSKAINREFLFVDLNAKPAEHQEAA